MKIAPKITTQKDYTLGDLCTKLNSLLENKWFSVTGEKEISLRGCSNNDYTKLICYISLLLVDSYSFGKGLGGYTRYGSHDGYGVSFTNLSTANIQMLMENLSTVKTVKDLVLTP